MLGYMEVENSWQSNCLTVMSLSLHIVRYEVKLALWIFSSLNYKISLL